MKKILSPVFCGITDTEFEEMKNAACLRERGYCKGELIFRMGDTTSELGIVLSGSVIVENTDVWGNTSVLTKAEAGGIFAETYALCRMPMMVEVTALEESTVLFLNLNSLEAAASCTWYRKMTQNLLEASARKNITLSQRMFCISSKTVRSRVLVFLSNQARTAESCSFVIPFDRQQMADYLNIDRSALSRELGKMKAEGLIDYHKNSFTLISENIISFS